MLRFFAGLVRIVVPILVVAAGAGSAYYFIITKPTPKKVATGEEATLVNVITAKPSSETIIVHSHGTVRPEKSIELKPQISGEIIQQNPNLVPGGFFEKGEVIAKIDPRDYEYALEQRKAEYERALFELKQEQGRKTVAEREWNLLDKDIKTSDAGKSLALREPHLKFAKANVEAKKAALEDAKLDLERTVIRAPFNAFVVQENVDIGEIVNPQTPLATLSGTDHFWVQTSIRVADLPWIQWPKHEGNKGSRAVVLLDDGQNGIQKEGYITRLLGDVEQAGRMARVLIQIDDPFQLKGGSQSDQALMDAIQMKSRSNDVLKPNSAEAEVPLLLNSYVDVYIEGKTVEDVYSVPWEAIQEGDQIWLMNEENQLEIQNVKILWRRENDALVSGGLETGDKIVMSRLPSVIPGMKLKPTKEEDLRVVQSSTAAQQDRPNMAQEVD